MSVIILFACFSLLVTLIERLPTILFSICLIPSMPALNTGSCHEASEPELNLLYTHAANIGIFRRFCIYRIPLRKKPYSNILKYISPPKLKVFR